MKRWVVEPAPGEVRTALFENGTCVELHLSRFNRLALGSTGRARIAQYAPSGCFLITDSGQSLLFRQKLASPEGTSIDFEIVREELHEPGGVKIAEAGPINGKNQTTSTHVAPLDASADERREIEAVIDLALAGEVQAGPARIAFQRTKAGLIFDVDGEGDVEEINLLAAQEIARLLRLFQISGSALIDFIGSDTRAGRKAIDDAFDVAAKADPRPFERTATNGFGLLQIIRKKTRPSLLDQIFGVNIAVPNTETKALWLLRDAQLSSGIGPRQIVTTDAVGARLRDPAWAHLCEDLRRILGVPIEVIVDPSVSGYGLIHASQA